MIRINRHIEPGECKITDIFPDLRKSPALIEIFGTSEAVEDILTNHKVTVMDRPYYMFVSNEDGGVYISRNHLQTSPAEVLHLDIIHELVHVKQHQCGMELFDRTVSYVDRCTEVEAYAVTVKEARRLGFTDDQILRYLQVEWITPVEQMRLARTLGVAVDCGCSYIMDYDIYLRRLKSGEPANSFLKFLGAQPDEIKEGAARFHLSIRDEFKQINGSMQEGLIGAFASEVIAHAAMTKLHANQCLTCVEMKSEFPASARCGVLIGDATVTRREGTRVTGICTIRTEDDIVICRGEAVFQVQH